LLAVASMARERDRRREGLVQQLQLVRLNTHANGWSEEARKLIAAAARLRQDGLLRNLAAASCADIDAHEVRHWERLRISSVAFDAAGGRLLCGGASNAEGRPLECAKLWDSATDQIKVSHQGGAGPVAFLRDGRPVQLLARDGPSLLLWDLASQTP